MSGEIEIINCQRGKRQSAGPRIRDGKVVVSQVWPRQGLVGGGMREVEWSQYRISSLVSRVSCFTKQSQFGKGKNSEYSILEPE